MSFDPKDPIYNWDVIRKRVVNGNIYFLAKNDEFWKEVLARHFFWRRLDDNHGGLESPHGCDCLLVVNDIWRCRSMERTKVS